MFFEMIWMKQLRQYAWNKEVKCMGISDVSIDFGYLILNVVFIVKIKRAQNMEMTCLISKVNILTGAMIWITADEN